jgi:hypothetical protein
MFQKRVFSEAAALDAIRAQARRSAAHMLKGRVRDFVRRPMDLDSLYPGLAAASSGVMIAIAQHLLEQEDRNPQRWFGFGGEVRQINARAALLLGRYLRRHEAVGRLSA